MKLLSHRKFLIIAMSFGIAVAFAACAKTEGIVGVNKAPDGLALRGFDAVAISR
jgi:hypothetical protein